MRNLIIPLAVLVVLAGCASGGPRLSANQRFSIYQQHAGSPVSSFTYFGTLEGWEPLGQDGLLVRARANRAYLLTLSGPCPELSYARAIRLSNQGGRVAAGFDDVLVVDGQQGQFPCRISNIQPMAPDALKQAQAEARAAAQASGGN